MRHRSSWLVIPVVFAIGACDLKPAPRKKPPAAAAAAAPSITAVAPARPGGDLGPQSCNEVGVRVADILIASATDAVLKAQYEQARADTVRATAASCTNGQWDAALRGCFLTAKTQPEIDACKGRVGAPAPTLVPAPAAPAPTRG